VKIYSKRSKQYTITERSVVNVEAYHHGRPQSFTYGHKVHAIHDE